MTLQDEDAFRDTPKTKFLCHELAFVLQAVYAPALRNRIRGLRIKADSASALEQRSSQASYIARGGFDPQWKPASRLVLTHLQWQIKAAIQGTACTGVLAVHGVVAKLITPPMNSVEHLSLLS